MTPQARRKAHPDRGRMARLLYLAAVLAWSPFAAANEALWALLKSGGQIVLVRHALGDLADELGGQRDDLLVVVALRGELPVERTREDLDCLLPLAISLTR